MNLLVCHYRMQHNFHPESTVEMWTVSTGGYEVVVRRRADLSNTIWTTERRSFWFATWSEAYGYYYACVVAMLDEGKANQPKEEQK